MTNTARVGDQQSGAVAWQNSLHEISANFSVCLAPELAVWPFCLGKLPAQSGAKPDSLHRSQVGATTPAALTAWIECSELAAGARRISTCSDVGEGPRTD